MRTQHGLIRVGRRFEWHVQLHETDFGVRAPHFDIGRDGMRDQTFQPHGSGDVFARLDPCSVNPDPSLLLDHKDPFQFARTEASVLWRADGSISNPMSRIFRTRTS